MVIAPPSHRFVGRERDLTRLAQALDAASSGRPTSLLITGSAGIGSSRLLLEARRRIGALDRPLTVLWAGSVPAWRGRPFTPIGLALARHLRPLPDDRFAALVGPAAHAVGCLVPDLAARIELLGLGPARPPVLAPERQLDRMLEEIRGLLGRLAEQGPIVVMLEDLQSADIASRSLVRFLVRTIPDRPICLIVTCQVDELTRSHPVRATLDAVSEGPHAAGRLELAPLDRDDLALLIEALDGDRPSASTLLLVTERSGGNPLVAEELVAARRELSAAPLNGTLDEIVRARVARRTPECRRVLRMLAIADGPIRRSHLAGLAAAFEVGATRLPPHSGRSSRRGEGPLDADLAAGLAEGFADGFVTGSEDGAALDSSSSDDAPFGLRHELIARAIAADLLPTQLRRLHAAAARGLADRPAEAVGHHLAAHELGAARAAATVAAEAAELVGAGADALVHLELAIELDGAPGAGSIGGGQARAGLISRAADAAFAAQLPARAAAFAEAAIAQLDERSHPVAIGLLCERLGRYRRAVGDHEQALAAHRRALELVPATPTRERAIVVAALAQLHMLDGTFSEAGRLAREAIDTARAAGPSARGELGHAMCTLGVVTAWGDTPDEGVAQLREAKEIAADLGRLDDLFRVYANLTTVLDLLGRREEALEVAYEGIDEARRVGQEAGYGNFLRGNAAESLTFLGRWDEARALSSFALDWSPSGGAFLVAMLNLAVLEVEQRSGERAGRLLGQLLLELETVPDTQYAVPAFQAAAAFASWRNDIADAVRSIERAWEQVETTEDWTLTARVAASALDVLASAAADARERRDLATLAACRERGTRILAAADASVRAANVSTGLGSRREADANLGTARAFKARLDGRDDPATWARMAATWDRLHHPYQAARARWREAEAVLGSGEGRAGRPRARTPLLAAAETAAALGAGPLLRELETLGRRALIAVTLPVLATQDSIVAPRAVPGADAGPSELVRGLVGEPNPVRRNTFGLSPREQEVLVEIATGRTNREIGERLFISQKTVGVHVGNILSKLGVSGRVEAATVAVRLGLTGTRNRGGDQWAGH